MSTATGLAAFPLRTLVWLVAIPEWTDTLAVRLGLAGAAEVPALLDRLEDAGLIERRDDLTDDGEPCEAFWLRSRLREAVAQHAAEHGVHPFSVNEWVAELLAAVELHSGGPQLVPWARVARLMGVEGAALRLLRDLDRLLRTGHVGLAARHVAAAQALATVLGTATALDTARLARRRLDRANREAEDERLLRHYTRRPEAEAAFEALLNTNGGGWGLHYRGDGGVGKTMLVRYLASGRFAADRNRPAFPIARVDFDHLDPRYPDDRPAEILLSLADDLVTFDGGYDLPKRYQRFHDAAVRLHEELSRQSPVRAAVARLLDEAVAQFGRMLRELTGPVVLVLDTCEELAKLYAPGAPAPAIDRTFHILETLHRYAPRVRVVFAGRRPLVPEPGLAATGPLLRERSYLSVFPLAGYSREEAEAYLAQLRTPLPAPMREAVLTRVADRDQYNPFDLTGYAEWAATDPDVTPEALRAEPGDLYVERRIIGRLEPIVREALPAAAAFGRFDLELLTPALLRANLDPQAAFDTLCGHEWVTTLSVTTAGRPAVVQIDPHLLERIRRATAHVDPLLLGLDAAAVIGRTPLTELPAETIEAAVALLPADEAAELWHVLDERILAEQAWGWAAQTTVRVAAVASESGSDILAAVLATQAAANLHTGAVATLPALWEQVAALADRHPIASVAIELAVRAALGLDTPGWTVPFLRGALADAAIAAAERLVDGGRHLHHSAIDVLTQLSTEHPSATIRVAASLVLAGGLPERTARYANQAVERCVDLPDVQEAFRNWLSPPLLAYRCRLALTLTGVSTPPEDAAEALNHLHDIDAERYVAAWFGTRLAFEPVPAEELDDIERRDVYIPGRRATSWTHHRSRPLRVVLAEAWSALGEPDRAAAALDVRIQEAVAAGDDPETVEACQLALLRLCRRYRTSTYATSVHRLAREGSPAIRAEAWLLLTLLDGEPPESPIVAGGYPAWWRCLDAETAGNAPADYVPMDGIVGAAATQAEQRALNGRPEHRGTVPLQLWPEDLAEHVRVVIASSSRVDDALAGMPDGLAGRAALEAGEVAALRLPRQAADALEFASAALTRAGFVADAARAMVLAMLAHRRSADMRPLPTSLDHLFEGMPGAAWPAGWEERAEAAAGTRPWVGAHRRSPELPAIGRDALVVPRPMHTMIRPVARALLRVLGGDAVTGAAAVTMAATGIGVLNAALPPDLALAANLLVLVLATTAALRFLRSVRFGPSYLVDLRRAGDRWALTAQSMVDVVDLAPRRLGRWLGAEPLGGRAPTTARHTLPAERGGEGAALAAIRPAIRPARVRLVTDSPLLNRRQVASSVRWPSVVALHLDRSAARLHWEQRLGLAVARERQAEVLWFRRLPGQFDAPSRDEWGQATIRLCETLQAAGTGPAWPTVRTVHVLWLRGTPVSTSAGWRLRSNGAAQDGELLDLSRIRTVRAGLVVLQAELTQGRAKPLEDQYEGFLTLAQDAADAGAPAVLIVPPLTRELETLVRSTLEGFAERSRPPNPALVLELLQSVKATVDGGSHPAPYTGHLATLDVILLMRTHD
jgi:hypothetical protein